MKRFFCVFVLLLCGVILCACCLISDQVDEQLATYPQETNSEPIIQVATEPMETVPEHSQLYIPEISVDDVIVYFNEVCLDAEFITEGDPSRLQKWTIPIYYKIYQNPNQEDIAVLNSFAAWLNTLEGFPGIYETDDPTVANLNIYFCSQHQMLDILGNNFASMDGGVTFWYRDDEIYDAIICYRTDIDQYVRNSVILEEIYNGLGPIQDTSIRTDSIIYSEYTQPQSLTEIDELILKLLYHPNMRCGMNREECEKVIRNLYY